MAASLRAVVLLAAVLGAMAEDPAEEGGSPVDKVVGLITELKSKLTADGEAEQAVFDKYSCWCEETTDRKSKAIEQSMKDIARLGQEVLRLKGKAAVLGEEIAKLKKDSAENQDGQDKATAIREKGNTAYVAEKGEMEDTIGALEKGILVLSGAGTKKASLLDAKHALATTQKAVRRVLEKLPVQNSFSPYKLQAIGDFLQAQAEDFHDKKAAKAAAYNPASSTIIAILKDMYDTFVRNLEKSTVAESDAQAQFEELIRVKSKELASLMETTKAKEVQKAETETTLADASQELDDTSKLMAADTTFFDDTKAACTTKADEWSERVRARTEEIAGIDKAIEILTSDDAKALFSKAIKPGKETMLLQMAAGKDAKPLQKAIATLKQHARKAKSLRLATLASEVATAKGGGAFDVIITQIDKMVVVLKVEEKDDADTRDWCKAETFKNEEEASKYEYTVKKKNAKIDSLESNILNMEASVAEAVSEIEDTQKEIAGLEDERVAAHEAFAEAKADDEGAIKLLEQAIGALSAFYGNNKGAEMGEVQGSVNLLQRGPDDELTTEDDAPEATFSDAGKRKGESKGIVSILTMLKEDLEDEIKNGEKTEVEEQTEFEQAVAKAKATIASLEERKANLETAIATANDSKDQAHSDAKEAAGLKKDDEEYIEEIKPDCDWMLTNFEARRQARIQEMEGLGEAKAFLQGAVPPGFGASFVQVSRTTFLAPIH